MQVHVSQLEREEVLGMDEVPRVSEDAARKDANFLAEAKPWKPWRYQAIVEQLARKEGESRGEHFLQVLRMLRVIFSAKRDRARLNQIGRAMTTTLSGFQLRKFVEEAIKQKAISDDFINTAVTLNQYGVDPHIILDFMAHSTMNRKTLNEFVIMLPKDQVARVVDFAAGMIGDTDREKITKLQSLESFPDNYLQDVDVSLIWSDKKIQDFLENVCGQMRIPIPGNVKVIRMRQFLDANVRLFLQNTMEEDDFLAILGRECNGDALLLRDAVNYLATRCSSLALYIAYIHRLPRPEVDASIAFTPSCAQPLNSQLHMIDAICKEPVIVRSKDTMVDFSFNLRTTIYLALMAVRTCSKVFIIFPKLFPDLVERIGGILCRDAADKKVFVYKGQRLMDFLGEKFGWRPFSVIDTIDICKDKGWAPNLDTLTEKTVSGKFCRRASQFSAAAIPNTIVLKHRYMMVSLVYGFGLKYGRPLRKNPTDPIPMAGGSRRSESATEPTRDRSPLRSGPR